MMSAKSQNGSKCAPIFPDGMQARLPARYACVWIGVGTKDKLRPSLRTGQADFLHPALQLVVTFKKIDMPQRVLVLRYTSPLW